MRTTAAVREFTAEPLPDDILYRILERARFAPSGGNGQGATVIVVRDPTIRQTMHDLVVPVARRFAAELDRGAVPWNPLHPCDLGDDEIGTGSPPEHLVRPLLDAAVVLVFCIDLATVAMLDRDLERPGVVPGASVYPLAWNVLLAARDEGFGGTLTTLAVAAEPQLRAVLAIPEHVAVAAVVPLGRPVVIKTKLRRRSVSQFTRIDTWDGPALGATSH